jgi:hypothetical protein
MYSDLEAKETANTPFEAMKMRTEEELVACSGGGA